MKTDCGIIQDLLPLYADNACSEQSRALVDQHLEECPACKDLLQKMRADEIENDLKTEKDAVIAYGTRAFKRRSSLAGAIVAGILMIPILVCLIVNVASGQGLGWFFVVLASLLAAASLTVVPLMAAENKLLWTFCAFCVSLIILLAVTCLYTRGSWFFIAASASLFGLGAIFLPFVVKARPVRQLIGRANRALLVLGIDAALFVNMMNMIFSRGGITFRTVLLFLGVLAGLGVVALEIMRKKEGE